MSKIGLKLNAVETTDPNLDPIREQEKKYAQSLKDIEREVKRLRTPKASKIKMRPSLGTRDDLLNPPKKVELGVKYKPPKTKKEIKAQVERKRKLVEELNFCKYSVLHMPSALNTKRLEVFYQAASAQIEDVPIRPRKASISSGALYPEPSSKKNLELKKPKSGIIINESRKKRRKAKTSKATPKKSLSKEKSTSATAAATRGSKTSAVDDISKAGSKQKERAIAVEELSTIHEIAEDGEGSILVHAESYYGEEGGSKQLTEMFLGKFFRKKVSQVSKGTSIQSRDYKEKEEKAKGEVDEEMLEDEKLSAIIQKFRRDSEVEAYEPKKLAIKKGTFESHSFTKLKQPTLKAFYFGVKQGSIHQGDDNFPPDSRNRQGICMPIAAFCYAVIKHPSEWQEEDVDTILAVGDELYHASAVNRHIHGTMRELDVPDLAKYCVIGEKKIRFTVGEPEVAGMICSSDKKIYNLTKAIQIFFGRNTAGILQTDTTSVAIWRDKHYYFFDAKPRTLDLHSSEVGTALMAHFYDTAAVVTVLLTRSGLGNPPFVIYSIQTHKVVDKDAEEVDSKEAIDEMDKYHVLDEGRAVVLGSFDLGDLCFGFARNKQSLAIAVIALVYSKITPPSAWYKLTVDKIIIIGNQLFMECFECDDVDLLELDALPAVFTVGPYVVDITIYKDRLVDLMFRKRVCTLETTLNKFFEKNTNGILQIGRHHLAVWKQRGMYHCFDPYPRNNEGKFSKNGVACSSMFSSISALAETISENFPEKDEIFHLHSLKVCKIHRDPDQKFPKNLNISDYPIEELKKIKMRKGRKCATSITKPVTVDYSNRAAVGEESPEASIMEVGSGVRSLLMDEMPPMLHKTISKSVLKRLLAPVEDVVVDLDSPSLSDTQIEPARPEQPDEEEEIGPVIFDDYDLVFEEAELQVRGEGDKGDAGETGETKTAGDMAAGDMKAVEEEMERLAIESSEARESREDDKEYYMAAPAYTQVHSSSLESRKGNKVSVEVNTDGAFFEIPTEVLNPAPTPAVLQRIKERKAKKDVCGEKYVIDDSPIDEVSQEEELKKENNFDDLPDNTQIILGTSNLATYGDELEFMAPFVCIMASAVAKKYCVATWSKEIVDYVLKCGADLYAVSNTRYDQVYRLEIPRITLGKTDFHIQVEYVFDAFIKPKILEMGLSKVLFKKSSSGILVTPSYACTLFYRNHLYYLYDCFACNEVGLGQGPLNKGVACLARFKELKPLVARIIHNKAKREALEGVEYNRFVLSSCIVRELVKQKSAEEADEDETETAIEKEEKALDDMGEENVIGDTDDENKEAKKKTVTVEEVLPPKNIVGFSLQNNGFYKIFGTLGLSDGNISQELDEAFFICLCACLMILNRPVSKWDTKIMDQVYDQGIDIYTRAEERDPCKKKYVRNVLIEEHVFNLVLKKMKMANWKANSNVRTGVEMLLSQKFKQILIQFPNRSYVINVVGDYYHLFDPCDKGGKASWTRYRNFGKMMYRIRSGIIKGGEACNFHTYEVTSIKKATKCVLVANRFKRYRRQKELKLESPSRPLKEEVAWLEIDPIPWAPTFRKLRSKQNEYNVEFEKDLFSLFGNVGIDSTIFVERSRGKQTLSNLVMAIAMTQIYELMDWTPVILDSVLVNGDNYFLECAKDIKTKNYELTIDDLKPNCTIFPYSFQVKFKPVVEGTMFLNRLKQFNLSKALRYFFTDHDERFGIIFVTQDKCKTQVAFGKTKDSEYFVFDCQNKGKKNAPNTAYILRCTTLNRLLYILVLTLRAGDFFIYDVKLSEFKPMS